MRPWATDHPQSSAPSDEALTPLGITARPKLLTSGVLHLSTVTDVLLRLPAPRPGDPDAGLRLREERRAPPGFVHVNFNLLEMTGGDLPEFDALMGSPYLLSDEKLAVYAVPYWVFAFSFLKFPTMPPYPSDLGARFHAALRLFSLFWSYTPGSAQSCLEKYRPYVAHPPQ